MFINFYKFFVIVGDVVVWIVYGKRGLDNIGEI